MFFKPILRNLDFISKPEVSFEKPEVLKFEFNQSTELLVFYDE